MPTPPPLPTAAPSQPGLHVGTILHSLWHGLWLEMTSSPWTAALFSLAAIGVLVSVFRRICWLPLTAAARDPIRRFVGAERAVILHWAGNRCERRGLLTGRCRQTTNLHVDHVHPHSRGGSTSVGNSQVLCSGHNKQKAARIPYNWVLRRLEKQRQWYFPPGTSGRVIRRETTR
jgi:hypothetical protein